MNKTSLLLFIYFANHAYFPVAGFSSVAKRAKPLVRDTLDLNELSLSTTEDVESAFYLPTSPDEIDLKVGQRAVGIGDVHGSLAVLRASLRAAELVDSDDNWVGGDSVLVQTGDILDRGSDELECWLLMCKIAQQASQSGGSVVMLWGNHEFMCSELDFRYATCADRYDTVFKTVLSNSEMDPLSVYCPPAFHHQAHVLKPGGLLAKPFLSKFKVAVKVGDTLFVHGGLQSHHLATYGGISNMNKVAKRWIEDPSYLEEPPTCPTWMREYSSPPNREPTEASVTMVDAVLDSVKCDRLVVGHTPQNGKINSCLDGKVWRIDTGNWMYGGSSSEVWQVKRLDDGTEKVAVL